MAKRNRMAECCHWRDLVRPSDIWDAVAGAALGLLLWGLLASPLAAQPLHVMGAPIARVDVPPMARTLRRELERVARSVFGHQAPVALLAAQVMQESAWRPDVCSPYACGLTQFTPETAADMERIFGVELGDVPGAKDRRLDPRWALRAQVHYMRRLQEQLGGVDECASYLFALSAYNGGAGWVMRDRELARAAGEPVLDYWSVTRHDAGRSVAAFRENRHYPKVIVYRWQLLFSAAGWGAPVCVDV